MKNTICQLKNSSHIQMMGYVIKTADGKIIVVDGGTKFDTEHLVEVIKQMSGTEKPRVDAWLLTHAHNDHIVPFCDVVEKYADEIEIDKVYYNFPSVKFVSDTEPSEACTVERFYSLLGKFAAAATVVTEGDEYLIGDTKMEILYTQDPSIRFNPLNNSSTVFRLTLGDKTVIFLGDLGVESGNKMLARLGDTLKSDLCQMAHHGQAGCSRNVYEAIKPSACFWCAPDWLYENDIGKLDKSKTGGYGSGPWQTLNVRAWMEEINPDASHYVEMDGDEYIEI